jgi:DNA-binding response OmpR family regulator
MICPHSECFPAEWGLTAAESILLDLLVLRQRVSVRTYTCAMGWDFDDEPCRKILAVPICKLRAKLARFGIEIETHWGEGYGIAAPLRRAIRVAIEEGRAQVGPAVTAQVAA